MTAESPDTTTKTMTGRHWAILCVLVLLGCALRVLEAQKSFWLDELHTTELAHVSLVEMVEMLREDFHAPLYYLGVGLLDRAGVEGHGLRALSIVLSLLSLWPLLLLAREFKCGATATLALAAVYLLAPFQIRYGAELRPYSALGLLCLIMAWAAFDTRSKLRRQFLTFALAAALALFTHYLASVFIIAIGAARIIVRPRGAISWQKLVLSGTLGVVLFMPWILVMESWLFTDPGAIYRSDNISESAQPILKTPPKVPGWPELSDDVLGAGPRMLAPAAASLGESAESLVLAGMIVVFTAIGAGMLVMILRLKGNGALLQGLLAPAIAMVLVAWACVEFWHRIPIQYFVVCAWAWSLAAALAIDAFQTERWRTWTTVVLVAGLLCCAAGEISGEPREKLEEAVKFAADLAADEGAHLTAIMRQPPQYKNSEIFRVYLSRGRAVEPEIVPADDKKSVVVITRRIDLADGGGPEELVKAIQSHRTLAAEHTIGRAVKVFVFKAQSNK